MDTIKEALTFDDVLLLPKYSDVLPSKTNITLQLTKKISLKVPFLTSAMDTVTESRMATAIAIEGGMGVIHRNLDIKKQSIEVKKVKNKKLIVGAAIGTNQEDLDRARSLISNGVDLIVIDTAHGHSKKVLQTLLKIKKITKNVPICVGNIATGEAAKKLYNSGADIIKVGIGPGSICTTRMVAGIGVPQISAIMEVKKALNKKNHKLKIDSQCKYTIVSRGQADAFIRLPTDRYYVEKIWDHAAGFLIATEAGAVVSDADGKDLNFSDGGGMLGNKGIVCASSLYHSQIIDKIKELRLNQ